MHDRYFEAAAERALIGQHPGAKTTKEVLTHLGSLGASAERIDRDMLTWLASCSRRQLLAHLRLNPFSELWHAPPAEHSALVDAVEGRLRADRIDLDEAETIPASLVLWRAALP